MSSRPKPKKVSTRRVHFALENPTLPQKENAIRLTLDVTSKEMEYWVGKQVSEMNRTYGYVIDYPSLYIGYGAIWGEQSPDELYWKYHFTSSGALQSKWLREEYVRSVAYAMRHARKGPRVRRTPPPTDACTRGQRLPRADADGQVFHHPKCVADYPCYDRADDMCVDTQGEFSVHATHTTHTTSITVNVMTGVYQVDVMDTTTIAQLKMIMRDKMNIGPRRQQYWYKGQKIGTSGPEWVEDSSADDTKLSKVMDADDRTINMVMNIRYTAEEQQVEDELSEATRMGGSLHAAPTAKVLALRAKRAELNRKRLVDW